MSHHPKKRAVAENNQSLHPHIFRGHEEDESQVIYTEINVGGKTMPMRPQQLITQNIIHRVNVLSPSTSIPATVLENGGKVDFRINPDHYYVRNIWAELTVSNTSTDTAQQLSPINMLFERVRITSQGRSEIIEMEGLDLYSCASTFWSQSQLFVAAQDGNFNETTFAAQSVLVANGTLRYRIQLPDLLPKDGNHFGFPLFNIKPMDIEFIFRGNEAIEIDSSAGDGLPFTLDDFRLLLEVTQFSPDEEKALVEIHKMPKSFRYLNFQRMKITQAFAANTTYSFRINSIKGLAPFMWLYLLPNNHTGQDSYNPTVPNWIFSIEMLDQTGSTLNNGHALPGNYIKRGLYSSKLDNNFSRTNTTAYFISFGPDPLHVYHEGIHGGYEYFSDNSLRIVTGPTLPAANYEWNVIVPTYAILHIDENGTVMREK